VRIVAEKGCIDVTVNDLKYSGNKFGKKMFDEEELGKGYEIIINQALNEPEVEKVKKITVKPIKKVDQSETFLKEEEVVTHDQKKIKLSRLDLFNEDE